MCGTTQMYYKRILDGAGNPVTETAKDQAPINAGTYQVFLDVPGGVNFNAATGDSGRFNSGYTIKIKQRDISVDDPVFTFDFDEFDVYNGQKQEPVVRVSIQLPGALTETPLTVGADYTYS